MIPKGGGEVVVLIGVSGAVQRTAGYRGTTDRSDRLINCYHTHTLKTTDFEEHIVSDCTVRMLSGWVVVV
jgi:hypothetical protein